MLKEFDIVESSRTRKLFQHIPSHANCDQLSIVSTMNKCNGIFLNTPSQKNNCIIFSKFLYYNCANRKLRKTSKQLLVIFRNKFPYKKCIFCFNLK